jgi:outer membrane cobalamin receptor
MLRRGLLGALCCAVLTLSHGYAQEPSTPPSTPAPPAVQSDGSGDLAGAVSDSANASPIQGAEIAVTRDHSLIVRTSSDEFGHFLIHDIPRGTYAVQARLIGYRLASREVEIGGGTTTVDFSMAATPLKMEGVSVTTQAPVAVDTRTGNQVFQENEYHGAPTTTTSQLLQQSIAGAVRAPTGEVHIRGQHAEYTYYIDGVPVLPGISGSLNELFDPSVIDRAEFITGGWDAEYGNKNTAIVNIGTRIPSGGPHLIASGYAGSFETNGQGATVSDSKGRWGWLLSGTRQLTNMRQEPVVADPSASQPINFHNNGLDESGFGKLKFTPTPHDAVNLNLNWSSTKFAVPYDSTGGVFLDDHQKDVNEFANLGWKHQFSNGSEVGTGDELFAALFARHGTLSYTPGSADEPSFAFFPDSTLYNISEDRSFKTFGAKMDYRIRRSHDLELKFGTLASTTTGREDFVTTASDGSHGPASNSDLQGHDVGIYGQTVILPRESVELRAGVRYDSHTAPFAGTTHQLSPRIKLSLFAGPQLTAYGYYGRLFLPTNIEDLRAITSAADSGIVALPTLPERDDFYELGLVRRFPAGVALKLAGYMKISRPGIDDNTVPGSAITTSVNLAKVNVRGIETVLEVRPSGPLSGYMNLAINHAYGHGPVTGGFFPTDIADVPGGWFDLDHDQRVSGVGSIVYSAHQLNLSATGIYGSGLTNGADITAPIGRGLFDFNKDIHVDPNFIVNASAGYNLVVGNTALRPEVFVDNVFGRNYLLKGAFFSGASVGRPRSVQARLTVAL